MTGPKCPPDELGALPLYDEQPDQDHDRERHDGRRKRRRVGLQAFDGAEHRDGRRNRAVTIEQGGADEADDQQFRAPCSGLRMARVQQRQQRDDAAFAAVVRAQDQKRVFDRDDQDQRPQDQRHHAEDGFICQRPAMGGGLGRFLQGVEGTGADVAVDDTKGAERGGCGELSGMAGGCNWRDGHWRPHWHRARRISRGARSNASLRRDAANCHRVTARKALPRRCRAPESMRSSGGIPRTSNQSNLAANNKRKGRSAPLRRTVGGNQARFTHDDLEPAARRQEASKFGQACCEQSLPTVRISRRSPLASACGTLASTWGAKPGNTVSAAAMNPAAAIAEKALIMTVPCHGPWRPRRFVGWTCSQRKFPAVFAKSENGFVGSEFCFVVHWPTKHCRPAQGRRPDPGTGSLADPKYKAAPGGNLVRLAGPPGAG